MDPHSAYGGGDFHGDSADAINASTASYIGASDICAAHGDGESLDAIAATLAHDCAVLDASAHLSGAPRDRDADSKTGREGVR